MAETTDKPHVLVVDDNPRNLQVLLGTLDRAGYRTTAVMSGNKALEALRQDEEIDLVLLDVMMPGMDGYQTCRTIKADMALPNTPIIFLTARTETEDILQGFEAGGVDYVSKPFREGELLARIRVHVELKRARDEIATLRGILPICAGCKKVRDDRGYWDQVEVYIQSRTDVHFSHCLCPDCFREHYPELDPQEP